jgi:hypothetical protein
MTLTKKDLKKWQESMRIWLNESQEAAILEHFGTEPEPYVWQEQDIAEQLRIFLRYGSFVKPECKYTGYVPPLPPDEPF